MLVPTEHPSKGRDLDESSLHTECSPRERGIRAALHCARSAADPPSG